MNMNKVVIIGSGPAGLTAAIYAARARLNPVLIAGYQYGGQLMNTTVIENYPGFIDGIDGPVLMDNMLKQAQRFGTEVVFENAVKIEDLKDHKVVHTDSGKMFESEAVILATGALPRRLSIPGEDKFYGRGVSTCATCDGAFFKEKVAAVVGGGDSAMEDASYLARFVSKLYIIHRKPEFRASKIMQERVLNNPKIEILFNTEVREVVGDQKVEHLKIYNNVDKKESDLVVDGMFLAIGHIPVTEFIHSLLELDDMGYVKTADGVHTSIEGLFVAGDVEDKRYRQAITAAGSGCKAAIEAEKWLEMMGE